MTTASENPVTNSEAQVEELNDADAEALFAEAAGKLDGTAAKSDEATGTPAATTQDSQDDGDTTGAGEGDSSAQSGGSDEGAATAASSGEGDDGALDPVALKAALEAAQQQAREFEQKFRSREGRERALQRELERARAGGQTGEPQPQAKPLKELLETDQIKAIAEEYPDFVPLIDALRAAGERVDGVSQEVGQVRTDVVTQVYSAEENKLNNALPDWQDLAAHPKFQAWVDDQPKNIRDTVNDNWDAITDADAVKGVFETFRDTVVSPSSSGQAQGGNDAGGKRQRQASSAQAAKVNGPAAASGESDDPNVLFAQAAAKVDRERGLR